tara:strand:+ start:729 stop:1496 length:768 start_codon:yes stop_codon:yes gene_type:complete
MTSNKDKIFARERVRWTIPLKRRENKLRSSVAKIFDAETRYIVNNYEDVIAQEGFSIMREISLKNDLFDAVSSSIRGTMEVAVKLVAEQIKFEQKQDFSVDSYILEWVGSEYFNEMMALIVTNYYSEIKEIIAKGIEEQLTRREIAKKIDNDLKLGSVRAAVIARTETHRAAMYASERRARDISKNLDMPLLKQWVPVSDSRVRDPHAAMRNKPAIPIDEMFEVGGEKMSRPNDPRGSARNTINCRCILRYIPQS